MSNGATVEFIDAKTLKTWIASGDAVLVDVRELTNIKWRGSKADLDPALGLRPKCDPDHGKKLVIHRASGVLVVRRPTVGRVRLHRSNPPPPWRYRNLVPQRWLDHTGLTTHAAITLIPARVGYFSSNTCGRTAR